MHLAGVWTPAAAQVLGVFRWQMQPYCNLVTFTVIQQGPTYQLTGNDNLCGAPAFAPATGTATPNPNGTISLGFDIVTPSGATAHVSATVNLSNVSGTWTDADGNTGPFVFNPPGVQGLPRPDPTRSTLITSAQLAASIFAGTGSATTVARSDHTHDDRYYTEAETIAVVADAGAAVVESTAPVPSLTLEVTVVQQVVTTPKAGRLLINMPIGLRSVDCATASTYYAFLTVDGTTIPNSIAFANDLGPVPTLAGVTTAVLPAGPHTIAGGIRCSSGSFSIVSFGSAVRVSAVVLP
jgi:hypothetical protein